MPPRFAYWTILIDNIPTAFRARDAEELVPTLTQLKRTNKDVVMMWFARGRLWASRAAEQEELRRRQSRENRRREPGRPRGVKKPGPPERG